MARGHTHVYYKVLSTKSPLYLYTRLKGVQEDKYYETRFVKNQKRNQSIVLGEDSQAGCDAARKSFKYRATGQWNALPVNIREERTLEKFKMKLRAWVSANIPIK